MNNIVLVTRPYLQGREFIHLLKDKKINALAFPCIEILPVKLNQQLNDVFTTLNSYHYIIFISANAVQQAVEILQSLKLPIESIEAKIVTIGHATAKAASALGFKVDLSPDKGFNSEALLALDAFNNINRKSCLIIRGEGGRDKLFNELTLRGALVSYAEVYRRDKPRIDKGVSRQQLSEHWADLKIQLITSTSNESLQNLYEMLSEPGKKVMLNTKLIVASKRGVKLAQSLGFKQIKQASSAMNQHILEAIETEFKVIQ